MVLAAARYTVDISLYLRDDCDDALDSSIDDLSANHTPIPTLSIMPTTAYPIPFTAGDLQPFSHVT